MAKKQKAKPKKKRKTAVKNEGKKSYHFGRIRQVKKIDYSVAAITVCD
jgi:hypothetical protein